MRNYNTHFSTEKESSMPPTSQPTSKKGQTWREKIRAEKAEALEAERRKEERREKHPEIKVNYDPESWREQYYDHPKFLISVNRLIPITDMSFDYAVQWLLEVLIRITFIERNLIVNGAQTMMELFVNLLDAQTIHQRTPFKSAVELAEFCDSMPLNFRKQGDRYCNTGVQGRRFVQYLKACMNQGRIVDRNSFHDIKAEFRETIKVGDRLKSFADQELGLDYSSLFRIGKTFSGFNYDKATGQLTSTMDATDMIILHLPIFADTLNSDHVFKLDFSRRTSSFACHLRHTDFHNRDQMVICGEQLSNAEAVFFRKSLEKEPSKLNRNFTFVEGCIAPNNVDRQLEVFTVERTTLSLTNNMCTGASGRLHNDLKLETVNFETVDSHLRVEASLIVSRPRTKKNVPISENEEKSEF